MIRIETETGSVYELDVENSRIRRLEYTHDLPNDGNWVDSAGWSDPVPGTSWNYYWGEKLRITSYVTKVYTA